MSSNPNPPDSVRVSQPPPPGWEAPPPRMTFKNDGWQNVPAETTVHNHIYNCNAVEVPLDEQRRNWAIEKAIECAAHRGSNVYQILSDAKKIEEYAKDGTVTE